MTVQWLQQKDINSAVDLLTGIFVDYPVMRYTLKDSHDEYRAHVRLIVDFFCEASLMRSWPFLGIKMDGNLVAAAGVNDPVDKPYPDELEKKFNNLARVIGKDAHNRSEAYEHEVRLHLPEAPHYFIEILGVQSDQQGKGFAKALLEEIQKLSAANPISTGVCLNTESADNVPLYKHLGYELFAEADIEDLHTWCMFRPDNNDKI